MTPEILIDDNGNLVISVTDAEIMEEIAEHLEDRGSDLTLCAMLEQYSCNGSYTFFNAGDGNPFVGLTEAPCIAESMDTEDDGENIIQGEFWCYTEYMLKCPIETLLNEGRVVFSGVGTKD
jgi:sugar/nucleoside kinase (ribokinase family)